MKSINLSMGTNNLDVVTVSDIALAGTGTKSTALASVSNVVAPAGNTTDSSLDVIARLDLQLNRLVQAKASFHNNLSGTVLDTADQPYGREVASMLSAAGQEGQPGIKRQRSLDA